MIQVLGLCRWSYPSHLDAFNIDFDSLDALRAYLYAPDRMELRLFFLEQVVLPCLRVQTDPDFTLVLMLGEELPEPYRAHVLALIGDIPQVRPVFLAEGQNHREACREVMLAHRDPKAQAVAEFRLDDDDAVAAGFVARLRSMFPAIRPLLREHGRAALDFGKGFVLWAGQEGIEYTPVITRYWTPGLAIYQRPGADKSLLDFPHMAVWKRMPTITWPREPMFIRGAHGDNDSALADRGRNVDTWRCDLTGLPDVIKAEFGIDLERLENAWMGLVR